MESIAERLLARSSAQPDGCILWVGARRPDGYGYMQADGARTPAHRVSWTLSCGPVPDGMYVLHKCDVRHCINPKHLFIGTHADNMADMKSKERQARGVTAGRTKLTLDQIRSIRADKRVRRVISDDYQIHVNTVFLIQKRKRWAHL